MSLDGGESYGSDGDRRGVWEELSYWRVFYSGIIAIVIDQIFVLDVGCGMKGEVPTGELHADCAFLDCILVAVLLGWGDRQICYTLLTGIGIGMCDTQGWNRLLSLFSLQVVPDRKR